MSKWRQCNKVTMQTTRCLAVGLRCVTPCHLQSPRPWGEATPLSTCDNESSEVLNGRRRERGGREKLRRRGVSEWAWMLVMGENETKDSARERPRCNVGKLWASISWLPRMYLSGRYMCPSCFLCHTSYMPLAVQKRGAYEVAKNAVSIMLFHLLLQL